LQSPYPTLGNSACIQYPFFEIQVKEIVFLEQIKECLPSQILCAGRANHETFNSWADGAVSGGMRERRPAAVLAAPGRIWSLVILEWSRLFLA